MNRQLIGMLVVALMVGVGVARAAGVPGQGTWETTLQARDLDGDGATDAFYDTSSDLTWLRNANINGPMTWSGANAWADGLEVGGFNDWRLPNALDANGVWCGGYRCAGSEMGHLWLTTLGNLDESVSNGNSPSVNTGDFAQLAGYYWSNANSPFWQTYFLTSTGYQYEGQGILELHAMAVRQGDVLAVPEPESYALALAGLAVLGVMGRRRR